MTAEPSRAAATVALPVAPCQRLLDRFLDGPCEVAAALLATADGHLVAVARRMDFDAARIATMSGSILALAEACTRELRLGACRNAIIDGEHGLTVLMRVATPRGAWTLTTVGARDTSMGLLYTHTRQLAESLAAVANAVDPPPE